MQPASVVPNEDVTSVSQQLNAQACSPEQHALLQKRFKSLTSSIEANVSHRLTNFKAEMTDQFKRMMAAMQDLLNGKQQTPSPILPSIETSPPAPSLAPPAPPLLPTSSWSPYGRMLCAEDVGYFDPEFEAEQEHGKSTPGPVVNAGKHAYYLDIFVFADRINELSRALQNDHSYSIIQIHRFIAIHPSY